MAKNHQQEFNRSELIWKGKYDESGNIHKVDRIALPFQVVETINEPRTKTLFGDQQKDGWKNKLIWGDNQLVMASLLKGDKSIGLEPLAGKINLIYIDPPFAVGADFSAKIKVGDEEIVKEPTFLELKAYRDTWGEGLDSYLQMMYDRLVLMRELLADDGSIYVHLDWHVAHYVKLILDDVFDKPNFVNDIIWSYRTGGAPQKTGFSHKHDLILYYSKKANYKFNQLKERIYYEKPFFSPKQDEKGRYYADVILRDVLEGEINLLQGNTPTKIDVKPVINVSSERLDYDTQKPEGLLQILISASSDKNDLVADFFCGSGTTMAVAQKLGRRWIGCDLSKFAIHTSRKRLMQIPDCTFEILNLGKYERQHWQISKLNHSEEKEAGKIKKYLKFIIELYRAEWLNGFKYLHGKKGNRMVHVGAIDAPVTLDEVANAVEEVKANGMKNLDILGWEWSYEVNTMAKKEAKEKGVELRLLQIPREVMEPEAVRKGDVQFFELAVVEVGIKKEGKDIKVELKGFISPNDEMLPEDVRDKIKNWTDWIDYWAVDFEFNTKPEKSLEDDTFHNMWQSYRTRKNPRLSLISESHTYKNPGKYNILVKVVDIFGNDTTKLVEVRV